MEQIELQDICKQVVERVDGALGCALVDLETGLALAHRVRPGSLLTDTAMELMSVAGGSYFRGNIRLPSGQDPANGPGTHPAGFVREIQTTTEDTFHFMSLVPGNAQELLIMITDRRTSNLGLGWMAMRQSLDLLRSRDRGARSGSGDAQESPADTGGGAGQ